MLNSCTLNALAAAMDQAHFAKTQVSLVTLGWGLAMDGHLILDAVPASAGGLHEELAAPLLWALTGGGVLLGPALWWLFRVFKTRVAH